MRTEKSAPDAPAPAEGTLAAPAPASAGEAAAAPVPPPDALTPDQGAAVTAQAAKAQEHWDRLLRVMADFDNYKKRAARERMDAVKFANEALLQKLVPVLDSFDAALAATTSANHGSVQQLQAGFAMIYQQLKSALAEAGLEEVNAHQQPFNPRLHEAVGQQESADVAEGQVLQQVRRGYQFKERLLRPASVVVAKKTTGK